MKNIIDAFGEFFDPALPKNDLIFRIVLVIFAFVLGLVIMFVFNKYFWNKYTTNKLVELKKENAGLLKEQEQYRQKVEQLEQDLAKFQKLIDIDILTSLDDNSDIAVESFVTKK